MKRFFINLKKIGFQDLRLKSAAVMEGELITPTV
jgi:hypothetical protein